MEGSDSVKDQTKIDRGSAASTNNLIIDNLDNKIVPTNELKTSEKIKKKPDLSSQQTYTDHPTIRGAFGITRAATVFWYICICILLLIAFIALILSVLYFVTDTSSEQIIKLYGICGAGSLALVAFVVVFLDCCNDGNRKEREQLAYNRMLQARKAKERAFTIRRSQRNAEGKDEKPKPFIIQHQGAQVTSNNSQSHSQHRHHHHHRQHPPHHLHYYYVPHSTAHDLHSARPHLVDVAVDTSDGIGPISKNKTTIQPSTHDSQTKFQPWDTERGTQTDRTEGTQTSARELDGIPNNVTEIIHERTILRAPRELMGTLKETMGIDSGETDSNELIAFM